jgi:TetR/AcrR family transcriptional regulator, cholesterol catabolism regulator
VTVAPEEPRPNGEKGRPPGTLRLDRWNEIVDAAGDVFDEKGYAAARIEDIAARVGLLKGSLYYYIDSKEDLLFAIVDGNHSRGIVVVEEGAALEEADPPTRLGAFVERWIGILRDNPGYAAIAERDLRRLSPDRQAIVMQKRARIHRFVRDIVEAGIADGSFDAGIDAGITTNNLFDMLNGISQWFHPSRPLTYEELAGYVRRFVLRGLGADPDLCGPELP